MVLYCHQLIRSVYQYSQLPNSWHCSTFTTWLLNWEVKAHALQWYCDINTMSTSTLTWFDYTWLGIMHPHRFVHGKWLFVLLGYKISLCHCIDHMSASQHALHWFLLSCFHLCMQRQQLHTSLHRTELCFILSSALLIVSGDCSSLVVSAVVL